MADEGDRHPMNHLRTRPGKLAIPLATVITVASLGVPARAQDAPASFVTEDKCGTRACTCKDAPMMERFRNNQIQARKAWASVKADIIAGTGPRSVADADKAFRGRFPGDPAIVSQFTSCSGYDATMNDLGKVAGVSPSGEAVLDPCFCNAFCKDMVDSTVVHEKSHRDTAIPFVVVMTGLQIGCAVAKGLKDSFGYQCDTANPMIRANSELIAYQAGIDSLDAAIQKLTETDPDNPTLACTWEPIVAAAPSPSLPNAAAPLPQGFFARVGLLWNRLIHGGGG
jgi:hypothetical protein